MHFFFVFYSFLLEIKMYIFLKTPYSLTYSEMINTINTMNIIYFLQQERKGLHIYYFNPTITKRNRGTTGDPGALRKRVEALCRAHLHVVHHHLIGQVAAILRLIHFLV